MGLDLVLVLISRHRYSEAAQMLENELFAARASANQGQLIGMLCNLGVCRYECNQLPEAQAALEEALALCRAAGNQTGVGRVLHELSMVVAKRGHLDQAIGMCKESLEIDLDTGGEGAHPLHTLSVLYQEAGQHSEALDVLLLVREACESRHELNGLGKCLNEMGLVYMELGQFLTAVRCMVDSIELKYKTGDVRGIQVTIANLNSSLNKHPQVVADPAVQTELDRLGGILG